MKQQLNVFNYSFKNQNDSESADIYIDGYIVDSPTHEILKDWWGDETSVSYKSLRDSITESKAKTFNVYINSGGGHVGDAMAIHDMFVDMQKDGIVINTHIRGICASAATYIAMSSKDATMSENSWFMIHNVSGGIWGDVNTIENYAKTMRKFNDHIVGYYAKRTGLSETVVGNLMNKETWMTAEEAKSKGFIKSIAASSDFTNAIAPEHWPYQNQEVLNLYNSFTHPQNSNEMDLKKIETVINNGFTKLMNALGAKDKAETPEVKDALKEHTTEMTNVIKELIPSEETINNLVNKAVEKALEEKTEGDAQAIEDAVKAGTKDFVNKKDLEAQLQNFSKEVVKDLGGETKPDNKQKPANSKNRFANRTWFEAK